MDDHHLDGNAVAGLLGEIAAADPTSTMRTCRSCGERRPLGEHRAYRGAGVVLRCPSCDDIAVVIGLLGTRMQVEWSGTYEMAAEGEFRD